MSREVPRPVASRKFPYTSAMEKLEWRNSNRSIYHHRKRFCLVLLLQVRLSNTAFITDQVTFAGTSLLEDFTTIPPEFAPSFLSTNIYRVPSSEDVFQFNVPVGQIHDIPQVEAGTALTIMICCAYLIYVSCKTALRLRADSNLHYKTS